jgi:hypothetical protein
MPNAKQPTWRAKKSTALAIRLQLAKNEHDESVGSSKARENFAIFVKTKAETKISIRKSGSGMFATILRASSRVRSALGLTSPLIHIGRKYFRCESSA